MQSRPAVIYHEFSLGARSLQRRNHHRQPPLVNAPPTLGTPTLADEITGGIGRDSSSAYLATVSTEGVSGTTTLEGVLDGATRAAHRTSTIAAASGFDDAVNAIPDTTLVALLPS
jgi:hypothetical protein